MLHRTLPKILIGVIAGAAAISQAQADNIYVDLDHISQYLTAPDSLTGTFNLLDEGYDPETEMVYQARSTFILRDGQSGTEDPSEGETVTIDWETANLVDDAPVQRHVFYVGDISLEALLQLSDTGLAEYTITASSGDFLVRSASLRAWTRPVPTGGATFAMLGMGILGLGLAHSKTRRAA